MLIGFILGPAFATDLPERYPEAINFFNSKQVQYKIHQTEIEGSEENALCILPVGKSNINKLAQQWSSEYEGARLCFAPVYGGNAYYDEDQHTVFSAIQNIESTLLMGNIPELVNSTLIHEGLHAYFGGLRLKSIGSFFHAFLITQDESLDPSLPGVYRIRFTLEEIPAALAGLVFDLKHSVSKDQELLLSAAGELKVILTMLKVLRDHVNQQKEILKDKGPSSVILTSREVGHRFDYCYGQRKVICLSTFNPSVRSSFEALKDDDLTAIVNSNFASFERLLESQKKVEIAVQAIENGSTTREHLLIVLEEILQDFKKGFNRDYNY